MGGEPSQFVRSDTLTGHFPFLPDLAQLEWGVSCAFHAHDQAPLDPGPLATWAEEQWQRAGLRFQPSVALVCSPWPIRDVWEARETPIPEIDIDLRNRSERVLIRHAAFGVQCESVSPEETQGLSALLAGSTLGEASDLLVTSGGDAASVSASFACWMQQRLIIGCVSGRLSNRVTLGR